MTGENFTLYCNEEHPHGGNVAFSGSPENDSLQNWFFSQQKRREKIHLLGELLRLYDPVDTFRPIPEKEWERLQSQQKQFEKELLQSPLYAARFIRYYIYVNTEIAGLLYADSLQQSRVRSYVRDSLDIDGLFTSGLWFDTLNGLLALYKDGTPYHKDFITDMSYLLERAGSDRIYTTLAENLFTICESTGWNDMEDQLAYYLINSGRIDNPTGKLKMLMTLFKLSKGSRAPELSFGSLPHSKVLLVFYRSDCSSCENEIQQLKGNYALIQNKGYEVVSVSADQDDDLFKNTSATFPWKQKYCDLQGFSGTNFRNYGVIGTPTFYVIDDSGIIQGRYARFSDTEIAMGEQPNSRIGK
jgi:hypothetical protein